MAANIDRNRQACNVGRPSLHIHSESRRFAAKALRADVQPVDAFEQLLLQLRVKRLWVPLGNRAAKRLFRQQGAALKIAADPDADHHRRAGVAARHSYCVNNKIYNACPSGGWGQHLQAAHVFTAKALGRDGQRYFFTRYDARVQHGGVLSPVLMRSSGSPTTEQRSSPSV